jgi:hypothetical protein
MNRFRVIGDEGERSGMSFPMSGDNRSSKVPTSSVPPQLEYIAGMLVELEVMAKGCGAETLAGILSVARSEALRFKPKR